MRLVEFSPASVQAALPDIVQSIPPEWLRARRWFAGKSRDLAGIGLFDQALISEDPLVLLALFRRARERWWLWIVLMIAAPAAEGLLKIAIGRARPESAAFGFPSGHATAAAAFFGAVLYLAGSLPPASRRAVRALAVACIVLVGLARIILRAHWPSDVLGGITLGLGLATIAALLSSLDGETDRRIAHAVPPR